MNDDEKNERIIIGSNIKKFRNMKDLSQEQLSKIVETSRTYISQIEKGKIDIKVALLSKIAKALGTTIEELTK